MSAGGGGGGAAVAGGWRRSGGGGGGREEVAAAEGWPGGGGGGGGGPGGVGNPELSHLRHLTWLIRSRSINSSDGIAISRSPRQADVKKLVLKLEIVAITTPLRYIR